ncbi:MAG: hypothetical protein IJP35_04125 [Clostridia bacterium]|nr:hypothetical protein [Clostridia bacterium]
MNNKIFSLIKRILIVSLLCGVLSFSFVGETSAYLIHSVGTDLTTLQSNNIDVVVGGSGSAVNAYVQNNGNMPAYVRVVVAVNWVNQEANNWIATGGALGTTRQVLARAPVKGAQNATYANDDGTTSKADYNYTVRSADWLETTITETVGSGSVSYTVLYYRKPLAAGAKTTTMFSAFDVWNGTTKIYNVQSTNRTFNLTTDFLVDAIQCETASRFAGTTAQTAVVQEWNVTLSGVGGDITAGPTTDAIPSLS